jgi:hypothetical protein
MAGNSDVFAFYAALASIAAQRDIAVQSFTAGDVRRPGARQRRSDALCERLVYRAPTGNLAWRST